MVKYVSDKSVGDKWMYGYGRYYIPAINAMFENGELIRAIKLVRALYAGSNENYGKMLTLKIAKDITQELYTKFKSTKENA